MNAFLCKAKNTDNAEWVEGYPAIFSSTDKEGNDVNIPYISTIHEDGVELTPVIGDTICKTVPGLTDIDDKPVFLGDKLVEDLSTSDNSNNKNKYVIRTKVTVHEVLGGYVVLKDGEGDLKDRVIDISIIHDHFRVVGNVWDDLVKIDNSDDLDDKSDESKNSDESEDNQGSDNLFDKISRLKPGEELVIPDSTDQSDLNDSGDQ